MKKLISELNEHEINYWVGQIEGYPIYDTRNESWPGNGKVNQERFECQIITIGLTGGISIEDSTYGKWFDPCNNPSQAWPIIVNHKLTVGPVEGIEEDDIPALLNCSFYAYATTDNYEYGRTGLIAAMRCRIAMVYGDSVEVDDE